VGSGDVSSKFGVQMTSFTVLERPRLLNIKRSLIVLSVFAIIAVIRPRSSELLLAQVPAQPPSPQNGGQGKIRVNSNLVILPVTVKDRDGNLVPDMERQDFRVFDDGVEQSIDVFTAEAFPLSLVVLVDDDLKSKDAAALVASLRSALAAIGEGDEAIICHFDLEFYPGEKFTSDEDELLVQLKNAKDASVPSKAGPVPFVTPPSTHPLSPGEPSIIAVGGGSRPTKALDDSVFAAAELLHQQKGGRRKIILLISDGIDGALFNHHTYEETVNLLLHENIALYGLAIGSDSFQGKFGRMRDYANGSGGDIYYAAKSEAMERLYSQMTEQARHEYTLAYEPKGNSPKSEYHVVRVVTVQTGLQVKTRQGYFANGVGSSVASPQEK
jgi:Ca-activated chloride channel homolog